MYAFLLFLGVLTMAVGFFAVGFGLSPYELSLGNALIVAGAVAIVGGMVLVGLALVLRQLRRIGDALGGARPVAAAVATVPARRPQPAEPGAESPPRPAPPPRPPYPARSDARSAPMTELPELPPPALERSRPNIFGMARGNDDTLDVEEPEPMPLVPTRPPAPPPMRPPVVAEPPVEPKATPADIMARLGNLATSPQRPPPRQDLRTDPRIDPRIDQRNDPRLEPPRAEERTQAADPQGPNMFDALWPADTRAARQSQPEAIARAPKPPLRPEPRPEPRMDPKIAARPEPRSEPRQEARPESRPEPRFEPPPMTRERMEPPSPPSLPPPISQRVRTEPAAPPTAADPRPIAILKSGVIDGMAYTLYTDGSIEAELPQGTMRFGSIEELRAHLEKAERQD